MFSEYPYVFQKERLALLSNIFEMKFIAKFFYSLFKANQ